MKGSYLRFRLRHKYKFIQIKIKNQSKNSKIFINLRRKFNYFLNSRLFYIR